jgi:hypothetical protein
VKIVAKALLGTGAWLLTVTLLGLSVWGTVAFAETRLTGATTVRAGGVAAVVDLVDGARGRAAASTSGGPASGGASPGPSASPDRAVEWESSAAASEPSSADPSAASTSAAAGTSARSSPRAPRRAAQGSGGSGGTHGDPSTPDRGSGSSGVRSGGASVVTVAVVALGGHVFVTCSSAGLADLRAFTDAGWTGRWARTGTGQVTLWFSRSRTTQAVVVGCVAGKPVVRGTVVRTPGGQNGHRIDR